MEKQPVRVLVTGAAGEIGYALVPLIARGLMLGPDQPVILHLNDFPVADDSLYGLAMELDDAALPLLVGVSIAYCCENVNFAVIVGVVPKKDMTTDVWISKSANFYKALAQKLEKHAAPGCKVLVVASPANTNALILSKYAPSIDPKNITCLTRLDHNRTLTQSSFVVGAPVKDVRNVIIWGNNHSTQYPDVTHATVGDKPISYLVNPESFKADFITKIRQRGDQVLNHRKLSSALSVASAACDHMHDWILGTPKDTYVSMGVYSDGSYNVPAELFFSFPVTCKDGEWFIVKDLQIDDFSRKMLEKTAEGLVKEKEFAWSCLS